MSVPWTRPVTRARRERHRRRSLESQRRRAQLLRRSPRWTFSAGSSRSTLNETAKQVAAEVRAWMPPSRKSLARCWKRRRSSQGDVYFFELGALSVDTKAQEARADADAFRLCDSTPTTCPPTSRSAIKHWSQMVDYWAVDWDFRDDTFHNQWQSYRTRKNPKLELSVKREYIRTEQIRRRRESDRHPG